MGWAMLALVALLAVVLLWRSGYPRRLWTVAATALMLGGAGYAWQGSPMLAGHPVAGRSARGSLDPNLIALRDALYGRFTFDSQYFVASDAMIRIGAPDSAAQVMLGGVRKVPGDGALWSWLGLMLTEKDGNQVSPAARFALDKGVTLWPTHPGPRFVYGLALVRAGEWQAARPHWARAVELAPANAPYREELVLRLFLLDRFLEAQAAEGAGK